MWSIRDRIGSAMLAHHEVEDSQSLDQVEVVRSDLFFLRGREVSRFEERPIFDVVSILGQVPNAVESLPVDESRNVLRQAPRTAALQNRRVKIRNARRDQQR